MIKQFKIGDLNIGFVLRHKYEKENRLIMKSEFRNNELGIWFSKTKAISTKYEGKEMFTKKDNLANSYMFGLKLIVLKMWVVIDWKVRKFEF